MKKLHLILKLHIVSCCLLDEMRRHSNMLSYRKNKLKQNAMAFKIRRGSCTREGEFNQSSHRFSIPLSTVNYFIAEIDRLVR